MLCYNKVRSNKRQGQRNCSGIARVWLTPNRCRHTVWLQHYSMDCIPTQTGKTWQLLAISMEAQAAPNYRPLPCLLKHIWKYAHVLQCTRHAAGCTDTEKHVEARNTQTHSQANPFYLCNLMFNVRAHRTPTAILKSTELLPNNINILKWPLLCVIIFFS